MKLNNLQEDGFLETLKNNSHELFYRNELFSVLKFCIFLIVFLIASIIQYQTDWGAVGVSLVIVFTYLFYHPKSFFHPCNLVAAFYFLYIVMPSTLNFILDLINYEYILPWGQIVFWDQMSKYSLLQIEATFIVLYFSFYLFLRYSERFHNEIKLERNKYIKTIQISNVGLSSIYIATIFIILLYMQSTGGLGSYLSNYSETFLQGRSGNGALNILVFTFSNISVFCLGIKFFNSINHKLFIFLCAIFLIIISAYLGGFKSRLMILLLIFYAPYLMNLTISIRRIAVFAIVFFTFLYGTTLVRTDGFYGEFQAFLEMLPGYFNAHYLHEMIVSSRDLGFFQTTSFFITKPLQVLGLASTQLEYDLSIMLTKEFYPDHWYNDTATQQWPLETDLYLNFGGLYLQWIPLIIYASVVSYVYKKAFVENKIAFMLVAILELIRIITTLRWVLLPWDLPIFITQYLIYFFVIKALSKENPVSIRNS